MASENKDKIILHLCADIGSDSQPYRDAGYDVRLVGSKIGVENYRPPENVYGIIANPPCTMFSLARTKAKKERDLQEGMFLVKECLRIIWESQYKTPLDKRVGCLKFWVIENPATGMLKYFLGKPNFQYSPHEYGADFTKKTALWGKFKHPQKPFFLMNPLRYRSLVGSNVTSLLNYPRGKEGRIQMMNDRSKCYPPFAEAFFEANP